MSSCMGCQLGKIKMFRDEEPDEISIVFRTVCSRDGQLHERCADYCIVPPPFRQAHYVDVAIVEADDYGSSAVCKQDARRLEKELKEDE